MSEPAPAPGRAPRDRKVVLLLAGLVALVLVVNIVSAFVPGMDGALATAPIIVLVLVVGTVLVLGRAVRRR